jgi:hypothetical protein
MIKRFSTRLVLLIFGCFILQGTLPSAEAAAQEPLRLSATAEQAAVITYSEPLDVRKHTLWDDGRAGLELRTLRIASSVRNSGDAPVRLVVFAVPDEAYQELASRHPDGYYEEVQQRAAATALSNPNARFLALFAIDIGPSTVADLRDHAPRDPAAIQRLMMAGPVRFGLLATSAEGEHAVQIEASNSPRGGQRMIGGSISGGGQGAHPLAPFVQSRSGDVSLLEARTFPGDSFIAGKPVYPGDGLFVFGGLNVLER